MTTLKYSEKEMEIGEYLKRFITIFLFSTMLISLASAEMSHHSITNNAGDAILVIYSNVTGFEVWFDGKHIFTTPPDKNYCWLYNVYSGRHNITLKKAGCVDASSDVMISSGYNEITINMVCGVTPPVGEKDSDKDGIPDDKDGCYNPDCNIADANGCPKDSDTDGLNDCDDTCPFEKGLPADKGCPEATVSDKDTDGIPDDKDTCYNPDCTLVDANGCPKDTDSDQVIDCDDECPSTAGSFSNKGCPEAPTDEDTDGIPDDKDTCYNPGCTLVDANGCPKDTDGDGVDDCRDSCVYEQGPSSNNGCPKTISQFMEYWWVIPVAIIVVGFLFFLAKRV